MNKEFADKIEELRTIHQGVESWSVNELMKVLGIDSLSEYRKIMFEAMSFTSRSNEEMLAAVRAFQARQEAFLERLDAKLEKEIYHEEMA